jgi:group II intron reverse transcriptase/maturase
MVLEPIYEEDFLDCSYGFRPGRSQHDALEALWRSAMSMGGCWVLEVDVQSFFDNLDHGRIREFLDLRVRDGVVRRVIHKWLKAGVMRDGAIQRRETGTPQGGVISPLLANIYLHHVLDDWIAKRVAPRLKGPVQLIRYADDFVLIFRSEEDARRVYAALPERFAEYGLELHPSKTRLIDFRQPPYSRKKKPKVSFDFLGFTLFWGRSRKGGWIVQWKTARDRFTRALARIGDWCRRHRHAPLRWQHAALCRKVQGHYGYYGLTGNARSLRSFLDQVRRLWCKWLSRRNSRARVFWTRFRKIEAHYPLPPVRVTHSIYRHAAKP